MSLNNTPKSERVHIALFGKRNVGKSSLINSITNQKLSLVSDVLGTTTDPVYKAMEILPIGPVMLIDTAGLDDTGELGSLRVEKTFEVLNKTDIAIIVCDINSKEFNFEIDLLSKIKQKNIPVFIVANKIDTVDNLDEKIKIIEKIIATKAYPISCNTSQGVNQLKIDIGKKAKVDEGKFQIVGDLINPGDLVVLVTPIDKAAPKGRLILPQQQVIRDILESDAICIVTKEHELRDTLSKLAVKPKMVITDSQVFLKVSADTPKDITLTSFSILFARYKGDLEALVRGAKAVENLKHGSKILIAEGCTHHRQSDDIGQVKIPRWLRQYTGKELTFDHVSGNYFPDNMHEYDLIIHCGACMLNKREMLYRIEQAKNKQVPIVNYGVIISYLQGIFERALDPFPYVKGIYEEVVTI